MAELWTRPWAALLSEGHHLVLHGDVSPPEDHRGALWLLSLPGAASRINGREGYTEPVAGFRLPRKEGVAGLLPLFTGPPLRLDNGSRLSWPTCPPRPIRGLEPTTEAEQKALALFHRVEAVWDRIADVETALADPIRLWPSLAKRWKRWSLKSGQPVKLFPLMRRTGLDGQGHAQAIRG